MTDPVLSWPAAKFRNVFSAALLAASKDPIRRHLASVHVARAEGSLSAVGDLTVTATTGQWLFRWTGDHKPLAKDGGPIETEFACLIPRKALELFLLSIKKTAEYSCVRLSRDGDRWQLDETDGVVTYSFKATDAEFPPVGKVIPPHANPTVQAVGVSANILEACAKAFGLAVGSPDNCSLYFQPTGGPLDAIACTSGTHPELMAIVMPRRMHGECGLPKAPAVPQAAQ